jgi:hypothetical protein
MKNLLLLTLLSSLPAMADDLSFTLSGSDSYRDDLLATPYIEAMKRCDSKGLTAELISWVNINNFRNWKAEFKCVEKNGDVIVFTESSPNIDTDINVLMGYAMRTCIKEGVNQQIGIAAYQVSSVKRKTEIFYDAFSDRWYDSETTEADFACILNQ